MASEIWSATLSGWPMVTDSLVNRWVLRRNSGDTRDPPIGGRCGGAGFGAGVVEKSHSPAGVSRESGSENVHPVVGGCKLRREMGVWACRWHDRPRELLILLYAGVS